MNKPIGEPQVALDDPRLVGGPYTVYDFADGGIQLCDCGLLYGYVYRPVRFTGSETGVMGTSTWHPTHTTASGRKSHGDAFPWFLDRDAAVDFLMKHRFYGHVMRYALDRRCIPRNGDFLRFNDEGVAEHLTGSRTPWITAGITDVVNAPDDRTYHGHLLSEPQPVIHARPKEWSTTE